MNAGDLDRRVTLLRRVRGAQNGFGEASESWTDVTTVWAQKLEVRDAERVQAQAVGVAISLRLRVRWSSATAATATTLSSPVARSAKRMVRIAASSVSRSPTSASLFSSPHRATPIQSRSSL